MAEKGGNPLASTPMSRLCAALLAAIALSPAASADSALARAFTVRETGWIANLDVHRPRDRWNDVNRDITLVSLQAQRSWEFAYGLEAQAGGGAFIAQGTRINEDGFTKVASDAYGVAFGGGLRWYAFRLYGMRPFGEGIVNIAYTPSHPFPTGGSGVNGYLRAGGGLRLDLSETYAVEGGYHLSHVSNGGGLVPGNPAYNGAGWFLNLRWRN